MKHLYFFMSDGVGINVWNRVGTLNREFALLNNLIEKGWKVTLISYDKEKPVNVDTKVNIISKWPFIFLRGPLKMLYYWIMPLLIKPLKQEQSIMMTNQASLGLPAFIARKTWKLPLLARAGYVFGEQATKIKNLGRADLLRQKREKQLYLEASHGVVPTAELRDWLVENYHIPKESLDIVPNYVDTDVFHPLTHVVRQRTVLMIARLHPEKRIPLVIEALAGTEIMLEIVGSGEMESELKQLATELKVSLKITPRIEHKKLPIIMATAGCFVISGLTEGHPKALIEAMACGMPCIGVDGQGVTNVINHKQNGLLVSPNSLELKQAILTLLDNSKLAMQLGNAARNFSLDNYSLEKIADKYDCLLNSLLENNQ